MVKKKEVIITFKTKPIVLDILTDKLDQFLPSEQIKPEPKKKK